MGKNEEYMLTMARPSIYINGYFFHVPKKVQESIDTYPDLLYGAYRETEPDSPLPPAEFLGRMQELMELSWNKTNPES